MILCFDIGNTHVVMGVSDGIKIEKVYRFATNTLITEDEYYSKIAAVLDKETIDNLTGVIISSVVPLIDGTMKGMVNKYFNMEPMFVRPGLKCGINIKIDNPKELGSDLLIGAVGAYNKYKTNVIIIDLGTASKVCIVNEAGEFLGGVILAGILTANEGLISSTSKLTKTALVKPKNIVGKNTVECIQSGVIYGTSSMIEGLITKVTKELNLKDYKVVLTGGLSKLVEDVLELDFVYEPDLLLEGLILIYNKNIK